MRLRIAAALAALTLLAILAIALALVAAMIESQEEFIDAELNTQIAYSMRVWRESPAAAFPNTPDMQVYRLALNGDKDAASPHVPADFARLPIGNHEIFVAGREHHVAVREDDSGRYILAYNVEAGEAREQALLVAVIATALALGLFTLLAGYLLAGRLTRQLESLAGAVAAESAAPLADAAMDRELLPVVVALDAYRQRQSVLLQRERAFAANLSHEIRTPLTGIRTDAELLTTLPDLPEAVSRRGNRIISSVDRIEALAASLLLLAREATPATQEATGLAAAIAAAWESLIGATPKPLTLRSEIPVNAAVVSDPALLGLVLRNLLDNALRYSESGEITCRLDGTRLALAGGIAANLQDLAPLMRNNKELRYLATPGNYLYSLARATTTSAHASLGPRTPIGTDVVRGAGWAGRQKPVVMVMVLGETARAANWGLSGYTRQTTPELAAEGVINFASVTSCGTNTETSVPCIFSPWGRRQYDEARIRGSESLLDIVARAGFRVVWIDNQSGCKGVCAGVESLRPDPAVSAAHCRDGECQDGALVDTMEKVIAETPGNLLIVLHQMGNHGPAYFKRYPSATKHYEPACEDSDLAHCTREAIVNAYDNALRYTDQVLARTVRFLRQHDAHDVAMLYVSDHGESLGENGLFLHGIPYAIAPDVQTRVPMVMWLSPGFRRDFAVNPSCIAARSQQPASHDNLFHSLLGILDLKTDAYVAQMDLSAPCRPS